MSDLRCNCCDLLVESCGAAVESQQRQEEIAARRLLLARGWFPAGYAGRCAVCDEPFGVGAPIDRAGSGWIAECCS